MDTKSFEYLNGTLPGLREERARLLKEFVSGCSGDLKFLRYLWEVERLDWLNPLELSQGKISPAKARMARRYADQIPDAAWRFPAAGEVRTDLQGKHDPAEQRRKMNIVLDGIAGAHTSFPVRWFWVSALLPYFMVTAGRPRWAWLASWLHLLGEGIHDEDNLRQEWRKNVLALKAASRKAGQIREGAAGHKAMARLVELSQMSFGAWSPIRWARSSRRSRNRVPKFGPRSPIPLLQPWIAKTSAERDYARVMTEAFPCFDLGPLPGDSRQVLFAGRRFSVSEYRGATRVQIIPRWIGPTSCSTLT